MPIYEVKLTILARGSKALDAFRAELEENAKPDEDTGQPDCITHTRIDSITELQPMHVAVRLPPELQALVGGKGD